MAEPQASPTKNMFDCLAKLYKQGQMLLMDADALMGERGWEPKDTTATAAFSYGLNTPERWYARWIVRFYMPAVSEENSAVINQLLFVSIHFASDNDTSVDEPVISAGRLLYTDPMDVKTAWRSRDYWMCKYWFFGKPHATLEGWHQTGQSDWCENLKGSETFIVPLYDVTSSEELEKLVISRLLPLEQQISQGPATLSR